MKFRFTAVVLLLAACAKPPAPKVVPPAARPTHALTPVASVAKAIAEPRIRVGMLSDQTSVTFPRVDGGYYLIATGGASILRRGFTDTAPLRETTIHYAVQAGAISDKPSADAFASRLRTESGLRVDAIFDPAAGAYRILVGDFAEMQSAQPLRNQLISGGYGKDMLVVRRPTDQAFERQHQILDDEGAPSTLSGESILVMPVSSDTVTIDQKLYRTAARVFINNRGLLNIINELSLEDYLRGVVPAEMGSRIYDEVEGLKAQAIAARTYAVRNLGQFRSEGYDICPGPACQAYKGFSGEEQLSDQAVRESAGLILTYQGQPIDALYTATCGGETSDVSTMFPGRNEPYLKRARCVEMQMTSVAGRAESGILNEQQLNAQLFAAAAGITGQATSWAAGDVEQAVNAAMRLVRYVAATVARPASSRRGDVLIYIGTLLGFDRYASVVTLPEDRGYFFAQSQSESAAYRAAAFLIKFGFLPTQEIDRIDLDAAMPRDELYGLLASWLRKHGALNEITGKMLTVDGRQIALKAEGKVIAYTLPGNIPIWRRLGDRWQEYKSVPVMIGDRAFLHTDARRVPIGMVVQANVDGASFDRTSSFASWTRSYRADELVTSINKRNPIRQLVGLRPITIDASQRIAEMEVTAEGGRTFILKGLPIRWSLNVPDNLFVFEKSVDPDGMDRYTFFGKGWGHGIGMCQVGAYGMAFRGWKAEQILKNYYTGVDIAPMNAVAK
ncbi:MAG TPA: SpoIID/LytB domain-containing protein [Thermoanaerobaculia bacterium]|nr:SpoIID/LytB domain-containing protein [Thermoanaerobaculia bacterium]